MSLRFLPLFASFAYTAAIVAAVSTPLVWQTLGSPDETYPELYFMAYCAPIAFVLFGLALAIARYGGQTGSITIRTLAVLFGLTTIVAVVVFTIPFL